MDTHPLTPLLLAMIVGLLLLGGYLLLLRMLKLPWSMRSITLDQARQRAYLSTAYVLLLAGAVWIAAGATAQVDWTWGLPFLSGGIGVIVVILGSNTLDQARKRVYLNPAFITLLIAGALWIVEGATAQVTEMRRIIFLSLGIVFLTLGVIYLIKGLRWKAGETP